MCNILAFDSETRGLSWFDPDQRAFLVSWADDSGAHVVRVDDEEGMNEFRQALERADKIVAHNLSFDVHQLRETTGIDILDYIDRGVELHDTDLMSRVVFPEGQRQGERGGHGLKNLAKVFIDDSADEAEKAITELASSIGIKLKSTGGYYDTWRAYPDEMEYYATKDAEYTKELYDVFTPKLDSGADACYRLERAVAPVLIRAEQRGVRVDAEVVQDLRATYEHQRDELRTTLTETLGEQALGGAGSQDALLEALLGLGVPLSRKTETGQIATHQFALQEFEDDFPVLSQLSEYRTASKFLATYIEPMVGREVVHPSFMQCGAWTGRMSCRRPNMQNIPKRAGKEVRSMFVPREGHSFVVADYESIEAKLLAYYLGDPDYRKLVHERDPHAWLATQVHGGNIEDYLKGTDGEDTRNDVKNVTYAICYGGGGKRITDMLGLDPGPYLDEKSPEIIAARQQGRDWPKVGPQYAEARKIIRKVKTSLPGFNKLNKRIRTKIETQGHVNTLFGRTQPVKREKSYVGLNALIQGSAADIMKAGLVAVDAAVSEFDGTPLLVVHDEVVVEVPTEYADECLRRAEAAMVGAYDLDPPLTVEGSVVHTSYADA